MESLRCWAWHQQTTRAAMPCTSPSALAAWTSAVDHLPEELIAITSQGLSFSMAVGIGPEGTFQRMQLSLQNLQIDDQLSASRFPVVLSPADTAEEASDYHPLLSLAVISQPGLARGQTYYPLISFQISKTLQISLSETLVWRAAEMVQRLDLTSLTAPEEEEHTEAATDVPMQMSLVSISSLAAKVSFRGDLAARPRWAGRTLSWALDMANFENVPVRLTGFEMENSTMLWSVFMSEVSQNIKGRLVGVALSFLRNFGILSGASSVLGALSSGVASAALDDRFAVQRAQQKQERSIEGVGDGMVEGGAALGMGIYRGFTGLVTKPVEGAKSKGVGGPTGHSDQPVHHEAEGSGLCPELRWAIPWQDLLTVELRWGNRGGPYPDRLTVHRKGKPGQQEEEPLAHELRCWPNLPQADQIHLIALKVQRKYYSEPSKDSQRWASRHDQLVQADKGLPKQELPATMLSMDYTRVWYTDKRNTQQCISFWQPVAPPGYLPLGHVPSIGLDPPADPVLVYRNDSEKGSRPSVKPAREFHLIWRQNGRSPVTMWEPLHPQGYRALGTVVVPDAEQPGSKQVLCVREDLCAKTGIFDSPIWKFEPPIMQGGLNVQRLKTYYPETWRCSCWQVDNPTSTFLANRSLSKPSNQAALSASGVPN
ncbi:TPA: hypothetical protein ACH3X2_003173 [Trebouxia sp. C0005]